jgi:sulfite reductase alpha subunit-like flavoprotein
MEDHVELMIVIMDWWTGTPEKPGKWGEGKERIGLSTNYIRRLCTDGPEFSDNAQGTIGDPTKLGNQQLAVGVTNGTFNFPEETTTPMVMTGLGTGLAPFRAFAQEWVWWKETCGKETGPMWMFYGVQKEKEQFIGNLGFRDELESYVQKGVLTNLVTAFSRDQKEKIYVQHRMSEVSEELYEDIVKKGGYFYLCGQAGPLEVDVENAIKKAIAVGGGDAEKASEYVEQMHHEGRYNLELY